jgi:hypothetical protein
MLIKILLWAGQWFCLGYTYGYLLGLSNAGVNIGNHREIFFLGAMLTAVNFSLLLRLVKKNTSVQ